MQEDEGELPEKQSIIRDILQLQETLKDLSKKVETTRDEHNQLSAENEVLVKYINNLMQQYGNSIDNTSNINHNRQQKKNSFSMTGKLNRLFGRSNATSNNISSSIESSSSAYSSAGIGGPGGGIIARPGNK